MLMNYSIASVIYLPTLPICFNPAVRDQYQPFSLQLIICVEDRSRMDILGQTYPLFSLFGGLGACIGNS